jgi:hypothetical protein
MCKPFILYIRKKIMESRLNINVSAIDYDKTSKALTQQLILLEEMVHGKDDFTMTDSKIRITNGCRFSKIKGKRNR